MKENSIEEDIKIIENFTNWLTIDFEYDSGNEIKAIEHILSDYKRVLEINEVLLKENEELTISNKEIDEECSRLEKKEVELINENEHYTDLIYALKTYYDITEEDLEKCMKNDR